MVHRHLRCTPREKSYSAALLGGEPTDLALALLVASRLGAAGADRVTLDLSHGKKGVGCWVALDQVALVPVICTFCPTQGGHIFYCRYFCRYFSKRL